MKIQDVIVSLPIQDECLYFIACVKSTICRVRSKKRKATAIEIPCAPASKAPEGRQVYSGQYKNMKNRLQITEYGSAAGYSNRF